MLRTSEDIPQDLTFLAAVLKREAASHPTKKWLTTKLNSAVRTYRGHLQIRCDLEDRSVKLLWWTFGHVKRWHVSVSCAVDAQSLHQSIPPTEADVAIVKRAFFGEDNDIIIQGVGRWCVHLSKPL